MEQSQIKSNFDLLLTGQTLIKRRIPENQPSEELYEIIKNSELAFTNLEGTVLGRYGGWPTKNNGAAACSPEVFHELHTRMGFNILSLSNNHGFDLGPNGILSTIEEATKGGFLFAGTGKDAKEANKVGYKDFPVVRAALVSMDCSSQPDYFYALNAKNSLPGRPGMNQLKVHEDDNKQRFVDRADAERHLSKIREAALNADIVIVYIHNHHWGKHFTQTPEWLQLFAKECIHAGATTFVCHGVPILQGVEIYQNRPIFYSLGNFIFHTGRPEWWLEQAKSQPWQSVLAVCKFNDKQIFQIAFYPMAVANNENDRNIDVYTKDSSPILVKGQAGLHILKKLQKLSKNFGIKLNVQENGEQAWIDLN